MPESHSTEELSSFPSLKSLLVKLAFSFSKKVKESDIPSSLPKLEYIIDDIRVNHDKCHAFHQVCKWDSKTALIHPCFIHAIAFPLHISLLLLPSFPFPLFGLVHIRNKITQYRPIKMNESLQFRCKFAGLKPHAKGWEFSIEVRVFSDNQLIWESLSTNLFINRKIISGQNSTAYEPNNLDRFSNTSIQLESNVGRQYARCSGDYNPIHLGKWLAKLFGFKANIAHGMWTKSWCLSMLQLSQSQLFENAFSVEVSFIKPLFLPNNIELLVENIEAESDSQLQFSVESKSLNRHLVGVIKLV